MAEEDGDEAYFNESDDDDDENQGPPQIADGAAAAMVAVGGDPHEANGGGEQGMGGHTAGVVAAGGGGGAGAGAGADTFLLPCVTGCAMRKSLFLLTREGLPEVEKSTRLGPGVPSLPPLCRPPSAKPVKATTLLLLFHLPSTLDAKKQG